MAGMVGADVAQLRALAGSFERAAEQLRQTSTRVRSGIQISAWAGPFAVRFRKTWDSEHSVKVTRVAAALAAQARQLRLEADQQERTSAVSVRLVSTRSLLDLDRLDADGDGVVITEVVGVDGKVRYVVTITGTRPFAAPGEHFDALENAAVLGIETQTMSYVEQLMGDRGITSEDEVLLVGYSQGGLIAQNIAHSGRWGDPLVVTWASPQVIGGVEARDIIRFEVTGDVITDGVAASSLSVPDQAGDNYLVRGDAGAGRSGARVGIPNAVDIAVGLGAGAAIHMEGRPFYGNLADEFDERDDLYATRLQARMEPFLGGSVVSNQ
jgi:uncharacterized protein YukE